MYGQLILEVPLMSLLYKKVNDDFKSHIILVITQE
jgi:hypothetical protein